MQLLGNVGSLYMVFLILLLILGLGMLGMGFINYVMKPKEIKTKNSILITGGNSMQSNGWLKLALFSFVGIIISGVALQFVVPANTMAHQGMAIHGNMNGMSNMGNTGMNMSAGAQVDMNIIINRLDQMQMQINQMQQQMMNGGSSQMQSMPQSGGMGGMSGGGMGGMSGGSGSMGGASSGSGSMGGMSGGSSGGMGMMGGMM